MKYPIDRLKAGDSFLVPIDTTLSVPDYIRILNETYLEIEQEITEFLESLPEQISQDFDFRYKILPIMANHEDYEIMVSLQPGLLDVPTNQYGIRVWRIA